MCDAGDERRIDTPARITHQDLRDKATLILTEGDSAKALAVAGLSVVGREAYGVYPLRGKFLNVRDVSLGAIASNAEVTNLMTILGLDLKSDYTVGEGESVSSVLLSLVLSFSWPTGLILRLPSTKGRTDVVLPMKFELIEFPGPSVFDTVASC